MTLNDLLLTVTIALVPVNWFATVLLWRLSRTHPDIVSLRERALVAIVLSISLTVFALLSVSLAIDGPFDEMQTRTLRRMVIVLMTTPAIYWLWIFRNPSNADD